MLGFGYITGIAGAIAGAIAGKIEDMDLKAVRLSDEQRRLYTNEQIRAMREEIMYYSSSVSSVSVTSSSYSSSEPRPIPKPKPPPKEFFKEDEFNVK